VDADTFNIIQREKFSDFPIVDILETENGLFLSLDSNGTIFSSFFGSERKLKWRKHSECPKNTTTFTSFDIFHDGSIILGTSGNGMYLLDFEAAQCSKLISNNKKGIAQERLTIHDLYNDEKVLYASTDRGILAIYSRHDIEIINEIDTNLPSSEIRVLRPSKSSDNLWIGTFSGLSILKKTYFEVFLADNYNQFSSIVDFGEIPNVGYAVGTYRNGVYVLVDSEAKASPIRLSDALPRYFSDEYSVMTLLGKADSFWIGYRNSGVERFSINGHNNEIFSTESSPGFSSNSISDLLDIGKDRTLVGTYGGGIYLFEGNKLSKSFDANSNQTNRLLDNRVIFLFMDKSENIWIGTEAGLQIFVYDEKKFFEVLVESKQHGFKVIPWCISQSKDGSIWLGTSRDGLFRSGHRENVENYNFSNKRTGPDAFSKTIFSLQSDEFGRIWAATDTGIKSIDMPSLTVSDYSNTHEIRELRYDVGASGIDSQNRLYFGGSRGFLRFRPSDIEQNTFVPKMVVSSISIGDRMYEEKFLLGQLDTLEVRSTDYWFSINYNVIDYFNNTLHSYRHKLTNFDRDWVRTGGNGSATYTNLPPGEYFFHAQGTDSSGNTNTEGIQLKVIVYDMNIEAESAIDELQEQLDVQDSLVNSVHRRNIATLDFLSEVTSLAEPVVGHNSPSHSQRSVSALKCLENSLLYQQDRLYADLHRCTEDITALLLSEHGSTSDSVSIINDVTTKPIEAEVGALLAVIIYELVQNSILHAFTGRPLGNFIKISVQAMDRPAESSVHYRLAVNDNGIGLPADFLQARQGGAAVVELIANRLGGNLVCPQVDGSEVILTFTRSAFEA
jgi:ligand-binding sensor domain-containing protein/two-component sensor histidine kinase